MLVRQANSRSSHNHLLSCRLGAQIRHHSMLNVLRYAEILRRQLRGEVREREEFQSET